MSENTNKAVIHHIGLKNFKGYQEASIPLAPITLFFGPNSAGKSTVFQVLYLLKQTLEYASPDVPLLFRCDNGYVDLGSFDDVVFDHDAKKALGISLNGMEWIFRKEDNSVVIDRIILPDTNTNWVWERQSAAKETPIVRDNGQLVYKAPSMFYDDIHKFILTYKKDILWGVEQECIIEAMQSAIETDQLKDVCRRIGNVALMIDNALRTQGERMHDYHLGDGFDMREKWPVERYKNDVQNRGGGKRRSMILGEQDPYSDAIHMRGAIDPALVRDEKLKSMFDLREKMIRNVLDTREYSLALSECRSKKDALIKLLNNTFTADQLYQLLGINTDGLVVNAHTFLPSGHEDIEDHDRPILELFRCLATIGIECRYYLPDDGQSMEDALLHFHTIQAMSHEGRNLVGPIQPSGFGYSIYDFGDGSYIYWEGKIGNAIRGRERLEYWLKHNKMDQSLRYSFKPLGAIRQSPRRIYWSLKSVAANVGFKGEWVGDVLLDKGCKTEVNKWLKRLTGYEVQREDVGDILPGAYVLKVRDTKRKGAQFVKITDVGFGISQVLPLVAQLVTAKESVITIEQPESQIHPALQADFAELVVWSMKENKNQVLVETHSEHLMLRIQSLIHGGNIAPKDVSVLYVQRNENGSDVQQLRLNAKGRFEDSWPGGFFPERRTDLMALLGDGK